MDKEQYVSWSEIDSLTEQLSNLILKSKKFSSITTLSRGGLVPSRLLADHLGIEKIFVDEKVIPANSLVVDDIFDSGKTFDRIISKSEDASKLVYATLFARRGKKFPSQLIYAKETNDDGYVVFPWDKIEFEKSR
ncbi:phosphoribosyltransferase [Nitrosopumilus oxyclinae]|uniref:Phosphoribosyltransferase n=1 Tax=Nitrosopumilus oxyclinae TaxID=1959104 RepID=A0A7D5RDW5_9ARCH|nr:phosphoribosyltransferase [Nitrosopumilus oxyclinae]QLH04505.1 phosphoribosyltransferase [Nitrosopumilus oxyclinae]